MAYPSSTHCKMFYNSINKNNCFEKSRKQEDISIKRKVCYYKQKPALLNCSVTTNNYFKPKIQFMEKKQTKGSNSNPWKQYSTISLQLLNFHSLLNL